MMFSGGMRNISAGAVLAISYFPPAVAVPVVLGMLFQQTLASLYGFAIDRYYFKQEVVQILETDDNTNKLFSKADDALYQSKKSGRNCVSVS